MTAYQTPISDFVDHADALAASCRDLTGQAINKLTVEPNATPVAAAPITAADCTQVDNAAAAVELRREPTQCNFQPLFNEGKVSCGTGFSESVIWSEDFEDGLAGWGTDQQIVYPGGLARPWTTVTNPTGHTSQVAFGNADGRIGQCVNGPGDFSSRDSITSPVVEVGDLLNPKLSFDHSVSTELGYDGGNLKVSRNGGAFKAVDAAAYLYNAPGEIAEAGNTNPLAGEPGFTGTDGGTLESGWGTSVIDLTTLGLKSGDTMQLRFDIGRDGCGGVIGWSVDNVKLVDCKLPTTTVAVRTPEPSTFGQASSVDISVTRAGSLGSAPTGTVKVTDASGKELGSAELSANGKATVALPADLPVGANKLTASYLGSRTQAPSKAEFTATVVGASTTKADSTTKVKVKPSTPKAGKKVTFVVKVKADVKVTGKVVVKVDGKKYKATLKKGKAKVSIKKGLKAGKHKVKATYKGSDTVKRSTDRAKFTVKR
jgi:hypothetical protein